MTVEIATTMHEISAASEGTNDTETLKVLFKEMIQMCLWYAIVHYHFALLMYASCRGNATVSFRPKSLFDGRLIFHWSCSRISPYSPTSHKMIFSACSLWEKKLRLHDQNTSSGTIKKLCGIIYRH